MSEIPNPQRRFYFIGVSTGQSSMRRIFPRWSEALSLNAELVGVDLPLDTPEDRYRRTLLEIREDPQATGALVTTHKLNLLRSGRDLFASLDPDAERLKEVACIVRSLKGSLTGKAMDARTSILSLHHIVPPGYWKASQAEVLCIGLGGSGQAFALGLLTRLPEDDLPRRITMIARTQRRIDEARTALEGLPHLDRVEFALAPSPQEADHWIERLPRGSLIANATGMGKDVPGSPITDEAGFPEEGIAWDFNYRGELLFLRQAEREAESRHVSVHDGWVYFLYGWLHVLAEVFGFEVTPEIFERMSRIAEQHR